MTSEITEQEQTSVLGAAARHKLLVIVTTAAFAVAALLYAMSQPPLSEASTLVVLDAGEPAAVGFAAVVDSNREVRNQLQIFRSAAVAREAARLVNEAGFDVSLGDLIDGTTFTSLIDTDVIAITFKHTDSATAEAMVSGLIEGYRRVRAEQSRNEKETVLSLLESSEDVLLTQMAQIDSQIAELRLPRGLSSQITSVLDRISQVSADASAVGPGDERDARLSELNAISTQLGSLRLALQVEGEVPAIASLLRQQQNLVDQLTNVAGRKTEIEIGVENVGIGFVADPSTSRVRGANSLIFTVLAGGFVGFFASLGLAFYRSKSRQVFAERYEPQRVLGIPYLADVPTFSGRSELPVRDDPRTPEAESFRFLAASLDLSLKRLDMRSVLVVSSKVGDGKSTVIANAALAAARNGRRVLVIDADFGNQAVSELLAGHVSSRSGLTELISGRAGPEEVVARIAVSERSSIDLLSRGQGRAVATEVFSDSGVGAQLEPLTSRYDLVLIDSPPLMQVAYASMLAQLADSILVVIAASSSLDEASDLGERLRFLGIPVLGYVYNKAPLRADKSGGSMKDILGDMGMTESIPRRGRS